MLMALKASQEEHQTLQDLFSAGRSSIESPQTHSLQLQAAQ